MTDNFFFKTNQKCLIPLLALKAEMINVVFLLFCSDQFCTLFNKINISESDYIYILFVFE